MQDCVRRNGSQCGAAKHLRACHNQCHFADVAIQPGRCDRAFAGTHDDDMVGAVTVAHLLGGLHQPLHVGSVYLDAAKQAIDPGDAASPINPRTDTRVGAQKASDWVVKTADRAGYAKQRSSLQEQQMARAGARLAELLSSVFR